MPQKAMFVQGMTVLTSRRPGTEEVSAALASFGQGMHLKSEGKWIGGSETWMVPYRPDVNGKTLVQYHDRLWPDSMGNPKGSEDEKMCFAAWSMGHFGPMAWPGMLASGKQMAQMLSRQPAVVAADSHTGFFQILTSYAIGAPKTAPIWPKEHSAQHEFDFALKVVEALLRIPGTLAYFNPNGAVLKTPSQLNEEKARIGPGTIPITLASEPRVFRLQDQGNQFYVDLCAINQLRDDVPDVAAMFPESVDLSQVVTLVLNVAAYLIQSGPVIQHNHTIDGPGGQWRAELTEEPLIAPSRPTLVFRPAAAPPPLPKKKSWFGLSR